MSDRTGSRPSKTVARLPIEIGYTRSEGLAVRRFGMPHRSDRPRTVSTTAAASADPTTSKLSP